MIPFNYKPRTRFTAIIRCALVSAAALVGSNAEPVPDFSLFDWNETSPRYDQSVSPRNYLHQVSGYYFGDPG